MPQYRELLEGWGFKRVRKHGSEFIADCIFCHGSSKFYLNEVKNLAICFRGCFAGSTAALISRIEGCDIREAKGKLNEGVNWFSKMKSIMQEEKEESKRRTKLRMPVSRKLNEQEKQYLLSRNVYLSIAERHEVFGTDDIVGMISVFKDCTRPEAEELFALYPQRFDYLRNRILWPIFSLDGRGHSFEARSIVGAQPKVCYPSGINVKESLFLSRNHWNSPWIILVEGLIDALTLEGWGYVVGATFSAGVSKEQAAFLHRFQRIYCAYDADHGGDTGKVSLIRRVYTGATIFNIELPKGKDPNDCTEQEFAKAFVSSRPMSANHPLVIAAIGKRNC